MKISPSGQIVKEKEIRAGFIGCGGHAFRNIYPCFTFAPINLIATCDLIEEKAERFAKTFGAQRSYTNYQEMLEKEKLDAVFVVTGYNEAGRPRYPEIAIDSMKRGVNVWIEKPPAASCEDIKRMQIVEQTTQKFVMVGLKKMFYPANRKARTLMQQSAFGSPTLAQLQYPQFIPEQKDLDAYMRGKPVGSVVSFLDHFCHPTSLMLYFFGMPKTLFYERTNVGAGVILFTYESGLVVTMLLTHGAPENTGIERTTLLSDTKNMITIETNIRVTYHRDKKMKRTYGTTEDFFYDNSLDDGSLIWEPEFSLGQLYNKALFLLGYHGEVCEFAHSIIERRSPVCGTLDDAYKITQLFEVFTKGPQTIHRI